MDTKYIEGALDQDKEGEAEEDAGPAKPIRGREGNMAALSGNFLFLLILLLFPSFTS